MPYLGSTPNASFSSRTKQDFTANGSTTAFTLSSAVASANDIEVFVGNVRQEPTDAYTVNGTTLTMSAAPANGLNFYVVFKQLEENSVVPADGTISTAKISSGAVTGAKIENNPTIAGNLTVSGTTTTTGLITASAGVAIGGTGSANTLDDYEEGTWTPLFKATSSNPTISYDTQLGFYTKIGNLVFLTFALEINTISSSGSGDVYIDLPFQAPSGVDYATGGWMASRMSNSESLSGSRSDLSFSLANGTNAMRLTQSGGSSGSTQWTNGVSTGQIGAATEFAGTYMLRLSS
ncbi:hypothetical protein Melnitz3EXVC039M_175 [Methylophilales phage Melnitz-3 EXVC039M]|nr:hypothetical protein Melnitz3EXVC039M_175 [Methylophilales phage Melnitz-3 EXVC039M]